MKYCKRCLYPENHPLNIVFDESGICSGCRVHEEKYTLDWDERLDRLKKIVNQYKSKSRNIHDCIIPVSGARDSYFIVDFVKNKLGLTPLLVTYNKQYNTDRGIRNLAYLQSKMGCDILSMTVDPRLVKKITRETLRLKGSIYWHCLAGQSVYPVNIAQKFKIPLIIWGAHQGLDQVGMFSHENEVEMTRKYRKEHDLMGMEAEDLANNSPILSLDDLELFKYPGDREIASVGVRGIYLGNYLPWDSKSQHEAMIAKFSYETHQLQRTFDSYNDVDCFHYSGLHDWIKFAKFGYGKVTDHASREIRLKRLTRSAGIELVKKYSNIKPNDLDVFSKWLGVGPDQILETVNSFRSPSVWERCDEGFKLTTSVIESADDPSAHLQVNGDCNFNNDSKRVSADESEYVLFGRGWVDNYSTIYP
ncbi:MAG: LPS biosynthesis protein [Halobacteriovorax sp.]|nr:LPS biosynthesis protein [Halobacteriovorax sp.]|tara:strand:+ start:2368 stop:3624 length:1257 start_codon:yes stop_codon:yes gene_type:complete